MSLGFVQLDRCPPGLFLFEGALCFKSEYQTCLNGGPLAPLQMWQR